jgi:tRNA threonylcarbamoyladenosine biosynthesis protein TsaE
MRTIKDLNELKSFAREFAGGLVPHDTRATVVGLKGDLGSGKTAFTKMLAGELGIMDEIVSPTFVVAKYYALPKSSPWERLVHIDLYRIENKDELRPLRFKDLMQDTSSLVIIEWPERAFGEFPEDADMLQFTFIDDTTRTISETSLN